MKIVDLANKTKRLMTHTGDINRDVPSAQRLNTLECIPPPPIIYAMKYGFHPIISKRSHMCTIELDTIMRAISIPINKYEAEEERLTMLKLKSLTTTSSTRSSTESRRNNSEVDENVEMLNGGHATAVSNMCNKLDHGNEQFTTLQSISQSDCNEATLIEDSGKRRQRASKR